jgi:hypothetical protein
MIRGICGVMLALLLASPLWAGEAKPVLVPYKLTDTKHVMVRVKINGKGPFNFIMDTGAPALFVATDVAKKAGVKPDRQGWGAIDRFELEGGLVVPQARGKIDDPFQLKGMNGMGLAGVELHGMIGFNLLAKYRITYDFTTDKLKMTPLDFDPPEPVGLGGNVSQASGLEAIGSMMKLLGPLMGFNGPPKRVPRGFLGAELKDGDNGVIVVNVMEGTPAAKAGLKPGDRVREFRDKSIDLLSDLMNDVNKLQHGKEVDMVIIRGGKEVKLTVELGKGL